MFPLEPDIHEQEHGQTSGADLQRLGSAPSGNVVPFGLTSDRGREGHHKILAGFAAANQVPAELGQGQQNVTKSSEFLLDRESLNVLNQHLSPSDMDVYIYRRVCFCPASVPYSTQKLIVLCHSELSS